MNGLFLRHSQMRVARFFPVIRGPHVVRTGCLAGLILCALAQSGWALEVDAENAVWGFDGQAVTDRFNPLSVFVSNPSTEPFDGTFVLRKKRNGARVVKPVFLSPGATRWVQLYPYVMADNEDWELSWGRGSRQRKTIDRPKPGKPAHVILRDPRDLAPRGGSLKVLSEELFPPMVTATDGLAGVVLDHAPRWQAATRQAFLDWIFRGGRVHLFKGIGGEYPVFPDVLSELNAPIDRYQIGSGLVVRHPHALSGVDRQYIKTEVLFEPPTKTEDEQEKPNNPQQPQVTGYGQNYNYGSWMMDEAFLSKLKRMTAPDHNWLLIYFMSFVYLLCIFPGGYLLGRRRIDYRLTIGALLGTILVFTYGFFFVGRRGYGETTAVHSVAVARELQNGFFDVTQWTNTFVTAGDDYEISYGGSGHLFSTCEQNERVNGIIINGVQGRFAVDIPPFSSRKFSHRAKIEAPSLGVKVLSWSGDDRLQELVLSTGADFPSNPGELAVLYRDRFYTLKQEQDRLIARASGGRVVNMYLRTNEFDALGNFGRQAYDPFGLSEEEQTEEQLFNLMDRPLMARSLGITNDGEAMKFLLPNDRILLFVTAKMPESFFMKDDADPTTNEKLKRISGSQSGHVLYVIELPLERES